MRKKFKPDSQCFVYRGHVFKFNNELTIATSIEVGQIIKVVNKDQTSGGLQVNRIDNTTFPPIFDCTPAKVDNYDFAILRFGAKYVCDVDTGRDDELVLA
jgi:hypothetical protein